MSRELESQFSAGLNGSAIMPVILASLTFISGVYYVSTGIGNIVWRGNTYVGVGSLGEMSPVTEGSEVAAQGMSLKLSGISASPFNSAQSMIYEAMSDYKVGGAAQVWFALLNSNGSFIGNPYLLFSGQMDQPTTDISPHSASITIELENKLSNLLRATARRYTAADQHILYPDDTGLNYVEILENVALRWGVH